jgi:hypothetical protein
MLRMNLRTLIACAAICAPATAQDLYDTALLRSLNFTFHDANWWTLLEQNYASQTDILADLEVDGVTYPNVGVRIRGNTSYTALPAGSQKVSLNVDMELVDPNQTLMGYSSLNLNNAFTDPTFCREVAYSNFLARYIPNGRANHVVVTLNGENWGVYANVQQWNKDVLRQWFDDEDGMRVKCANNPNGPGLRYVGSNPSLYSTYEIKDDGGLADPVGALIDVCWWVTNGPLATWTDIDSVFAIDPSTWDVALENLFSDDDSYINKGCDFVTYRDPRDGRMHLQQTDGNETFKFPTWSPTRNFTSSTKPVLSRVLSVPELRQRYMAHLRAALREFTVADFDVEFLQYRALIDAAVQADPKKLYTYTQFVNNFTTSVNLPAGPGGGTVPGLLPFVTQRVALMNTDPEVSAPAPAVANVHHTPDAPNPGDAVWVRATVTPNVHAISKVELSYLPAPGRYQRTPMRDDGLSNDGAAGDGVWGALLPVSGVAGQSVKYYVGATAANTYLSTTFEPVRTELQPRAIDYSFGSAGLRITEYMYQGTDGEFFELTNMTAAPIDVSGWSMDDDSNTPGVVDLSAAGSIAPGESIVVTEATPSAFAAAWALSGVTVLGPVTAAGLGRNDQINVYDAQGALVDRLTYGDESFPGSIRTRDFSGQTCLDQLGTNDAYAWTLSALGDAWGSVASTGGDLGTPGVHNAPPCDLPIGVNYCTALPNQSGTTASMSALGSAAAASQHITLGANAANPSVPGMFLFGFAPVQVPLGVGNRCVGGGLQRLPVLMTNASGAASFPLDFNAPYGAAFTAGATLYFQLWYRDGSSSNLSDGLRIDLH